MYNKPLQTVGRSVKCQIPQIFLFKAKEGQAF